MGPITSALLAVIASLAAKLGLASLRVLIALARNSALKGVESAMEVGREVVLELERNPPTDMPKAQAFIERVGVRLLQEGLEIAQSDINLARELLVKEMRLLLAQDPA